MKQRHHPQIGPLKNLPWSDTTPVATPLGETLQRTARITRDKNTMFNHWQEHRDNLKKAGYRIHLQNGTWVITQTTIPPQKPTTLRKKLHQYLNTRKYYPTPHRRISSINYQHAPAVLQAWAQHGQEFEKRGYELIRIDQDKWSISAPLTKRESRPSLRTHLQEHAI